MKICNIILCLNAGGAENAATIISNHLSKNHEVSFLLFVKREKWPIFYKLDNKIKVIDLDIFKKSFNFILAIKNNIKRILVIRKKIKKIDPDVIIAHCSREIVLTFISTLFLKKKIIGYIHSDPSRLIKENSKTWLFFSYIAFSLINHCIIFSNETKKKLPFLAKRKSIIIPNVSSEVNEIKKDYKEKNIIMIGSLISLKNHKFVINNFKKILEKFPKWKLTIIGDGPLKKNLKSLVKKNKLVKNIFLIGNKKNIFQYFRKASIFLLSSISEGMNLSLIEAIKFGLPVISSECSVSHKKLIIQNHNGFLYKQNSTKNFIKYLSILINSEKKRKKFGRASIKVSRKFRNRFILEKWNKILEKI
jgi:GalNAc-alpha-(1->4)-GalNAc-alpha-(1->3)-diNAcBac-PP-undecaprenol alpha-1,4-N-acetyl-D-galactosaminyltransferase